MVNAEESEAGRPTPEAIAKRAYELYLQRGSVPGYELDDWLQAEAELTAAAAADAAEDRRRDPGQPGDGTSEREPRTEGRRPSTRERSSTRRTLRT
jgi:hypothetical protein